MLKCSCLGENLTNKNQEVWLPGTAHNSKYLEGWGREKIGEFKASQDSSASPCPKINSDQRAGGYSSGAELLASRSRACVQFLVHLTQNKIFEILKSIKSGLSCKLGVNINQIGMNTGSGVTFLITHGFPYCDCIILLLLFRKLVRGNATRVSCLEESVGLKVTSWQWDRTHVEPPYSNSKVLLVCKSPRGGNAQRQGNFK